MPELVRFTLSAALMLLVLGALVATWPATEGQHDCGIVGVLQARCK